MSMVNTRFKRTRRFEAEAYQPCPVSQETERTIYIYRLAQVIEVRFSAGV